MTEDDTFMKLRLGHLEAKKDVLTKRVRQYNLDNDFGGFYEFREANQELLDVHSEMIKILQEEAAKIEEELERRK